ncbi:hypothetical protein C0Q70_05042 [Pomacea canaliculata]|uniref:BTB domain-containing protein n=1 Tax=Pomacea canaliculata TaxID=400727 RepID=A0A2T7PK18_POMCA|nr:hypothetical protein C0Q70_05042 [Pomacea canaliculata]
MAVLCVCVFLQVCFQLIDRLLQGAVLGTFSDLTQAADLLLTPDNAALQNFLEAFVMAADSPYGCLMVDGHVVVATQKWWSLSGTELVLLGMLVSGLPPSTSRDVPIYLPHGSPTVPHRLLTFQLINGVEACVICGPKPTLFDLQGEVVRFWRPALDILRTASHVIPCNFPNTVSLDQNILGFLLVNNETSRCLNTVGVNRDNAAGLTMDKRREILRSFYKKVIGTYFSSPIEGSERGPTEFSHVPTDTYIVCDSYKCYALVAGSYQIFVLYSSAIPTYAMSMSDCGDWRKNLTFSRDKLLQEVTVTSKLLSFKYLCIFQPLEMTNPIVTLNVGGILYTTTTSTLQKYPDSMLGALTSGKHCTMLDNHEMDLLVAEADFYQVKPLIDVLRHKCQERPAEVFYYLEITEIRTGSTATMPTNNSRVKTILSGRKDVILSLPSTVIGADVMEKLQCKDNLDHMEVELYGSSARLKVGEELKNKGWEMVASDLSSSSAFDGRSSIIVWL